MCWTTYKSNNCMNFVELWRSPQSESSVTRTLLLHEDSSCRTVVFPLPPSSSSFPHSLQSLCTAEETWTVPSSHHDCSHSLSSQPAKTHRLQFAKEGKDFKPTPLYCVYNDVQLLREITWNVETRDTSKTLLINSVHKDCKGKSHSLSLFS